MLKIDNALRKVRIMTTVLVLFAMYRIRGYTVQYDSSMFQDYDPTI